MDNKNNKLLLSLTIFLGVLVIILGGYITYDKIIKQEEINNQNNENLNNENTLDNINSGTILKLDNNKDWVYDASYNLPTNKESYYGYLDHTKLISASDLIVPYININSNDAKNVNQEIYKLYEELINKFNENLKEEVWFTLVEYKTYLNSNILSVVITTELAGTSVPVYEYYTYNFNLNNGKLLSYKELYKNLGYNDEDIENKVKQSIIKILKEKSFEDENSKNNSINNYKDSLKDNSIRYFLNEDKKINITVNLSIPVQSSGSEIIVLE